MELGELKAKEQMIALTKSAASESTKIEQARTFAEVAMQVDLAKRYPRNMNDVFRRIEETFERSPGLLLKAKWKPFRRGNQEIRGYTIQFARAIAECVGNIKYSFRELSRQKGQSEMMVYAWDMETNTIQDRTIIILHTRDKTNYNTGERYTEPIVHERDIYENNANFAARRLRECILGVLPAAARRKGEEVVEELLEKAFPEHKFQEYIDNAIIKFKTLGVSREMLIKERGGRPPETWTRNDIVILKTYAEEISKEELTIEEIFETKKTKKASIKTPRGTKKAPTPPAPDISTPPNVDEPGEPFATPTPEPKHPDVLKLKNMLLSPDWKAPVEESIKRGEYSEDDWEKIITSNARSLALDAIDYLEDLKKEMKK
jgi:hypothetical protein